MVILRKSQKEGVRMIIDAWNSDKGNCRPVIFQKQWHLLCCSCEKKLAYYLYAGEGAHRSEGKKALLDRTSAGSFSPISFFRII
jgi:hypothetical protein